MRNSIHTFAALVIATIIVGGCRTTPKSAEKKQDLVQSAQRQLDAMTRKDANLKDFVDRGYGYAMFPKVGKGGLIAGGAYGRGVVYEQGQMIGYADLTQATIGLQAGGQTYSELIVFQDKNALDRFRANSLELTANASAVIIESGAGAAAKYENGVAIFIMPRAGAMAEAAVGGQKFTFVSDDVARASTRPAKSRSE